MIELTKLASQLRTFWLRDIEAVANGSSVLSDTGSLVVARTLYVPSVGGSVGINVQPNPDDIYALDILGNVRVAGNVYSESGNTWTIGANGQPWGAVYASELHVGSLVAETKLATLGGRIIVAPATKLILAMTTGATTMDVVSGALSVGDRLYLESTGKVEWIGVAAGAPTAVTNGYRYNVTRNLNGAGAQTWAAGDAVINTMTAGKGWIDMYSNYGVPASGETSTTRVGPTIVGLQRGSSTYNDFGTRWALGNLNGLYDYVADVHGFASGRQQLAWIAVDDSNGIRLMNSGTMLGQWSASGGIQVGQVAAGKGNVIISAGQIDIRTNTTSRIVLSSAGVLTINNSAGAPVFTFDSSAGAQFTLPLTLGAAGGIYQGTGTFASPTTGLKIWNPTGGATDGGKIAGYAGGTPQWYAETDGKLYAGGGAVTLDASGITLAMGSGYTTENAIKFGTASGVQIYSGYSWGTKRLFLVSTPAPNDNAEINIWSRPAGGTGTGLIDISADTPSLSSGGGYGGIGYIRIRGSGAHTIWGSLGFLGTTSGTATIVAKANAGTPTLTLPTSTGTLALTSDITSAVSGTSGTLAKFTGTNAVGDSILTESGSTITLPGDLTFSGSARRIIGDFSNATRGNRLMFQNSVANDGTNVGALPSGTGTAAAFSAFSSSDTETSCYVMQLQSSSTRGPWLNAQQITAGVVTAASMRFDTNSNEAMRITANRALVVGGSGVPTTVADSVGNVEINGVLAIKGGTTSMLLDIWGNNVRVGADTSLNSRTNATNKVQCILLPHYTSSEEDVAIAISGSQSANQFLNIGGGSASYNTAKTIDFYCAANTTTLTGTNVFGLTYNSATVKSGYFAGNMDTMTYASPITLDVTLGNLHKTTTVHATGSVTINASAAGVAGQSIRVLIINDATSGKTITFGTNFKPSATVVGTVSKAAIVTFESDGINWYEVSRTLNL